MPHIAFHPGALAAAVLAAFVVNALWYSVLWSGAWRSEMRRFRPGFDPDSVAQPLAMALTLAGSVVMMAVLAQMLGAWDPTSWGVSEGPGTVERIVSAAVFTWLGFAVPPLLHQVAWEGRPWRLFLINAGAVLVTLVAGAVCLATIPV